MKFNIVVHYFKACTFTLSFIFFLLYTLSTASLFASNLWLSQWSNDAQKQNLTQDFRKMRLAVFTSIGTFQGLLTIRI